MSLAPHVPGLLVALALVASGGAGCAPGAPRAAEVPRPALESPLRVGPHAFHRRRLANGLRAVAVRDAGETVSIFVVVGAGGRQETPDTVGLAHLTEHAMFAGTPTTGEGDHERRVAGWGGEANAYTRQDFTLYYDAGLPLERLDAVLAMEADRLHNLSLEEPAVLRERERLRAEEAHTYQAGEGRDEALEATVFRQHPYRAGLRDADGHTRAPELGVGAVRDFYDAGYHPSNTAVVVVGPLDPERSLDAIEAAFGSLPAGPALAPPPEEPWIEESREVRLASQLPRDRVELVWLVPERADPVRPTLLVLAHVLDRRTLGDGQPVEVSMGDRVDRELFRLAASGPGAREELLRLVDRARREPPDPAELAQVKALLRDEFAGRPLRARPYFSLAAAFGVYEVADQAELLTGWEGAIDAVEATDVLAAARRFLDPDRMVAVVFQGTGAEVASLPDDPAGLRAAAIDAADSGDFERAVAAYTRLLELGPNAMNQVIYLTSRGQVELQRRDYDAAIADFEAALRVVDYPAVRDLLEEAHARKAAALRGSFDDEDG